MGLTSTAIAVDALLKTNHDTSLADFLTDKRDEGHSFDRIARDLRDLTAGGISLTGNTIRNWINDLEAVA